MKKINSYFYTYNNRFGTYFWLYNVYKNGEITLNLPTSEILENYGIIKCDEKDFSKIAKEDYEYYRKEKYQYEVLVNNKKW